MARSEYEISNTNNTIEISLGATNNFMFICKIFNLFAVSCVCRILSPAGLSVPNGEGAEIGISQLKVSLKLASGLIIPLYFVLLIRN